MGAKGDALGFPHNLKEILKFFFNNLKCTCSTIVKLYSPPEMPILLHVYVQKGKIFSSTLKKFPLKKIK